MGSLLKGALLTLVAFAVCWGGAIAYWRTTNREPSGTDLAIWMLGLPLALLALFLIGRKLLAMRAASVAAAAAPAAPAAASNAPSAPAPSLAVLASALRTPHGQTPEELAAAIDEGKARAELDAELLNDEGYPVMSARVAEADDEAIREEIAQWLQAQGLPDPQLSNEQWRALCMGTGVVAELAQQATAHPYAQAPQAPHLAPPQHQHQQQAPMLHLVVLLGAAWTEPQRAAASQWLRHGAVLAGWPEARVAANSPAAAVPGAAASSALALLTNIAAAGKEPLLAMVVALDSNIGEASVERLAAEGKLFGAARPQGTIPGEGAAGLLVSDAATAQLMGIEAPLIHALSAARDGSADIARRPDAATLRTLLARAATQGDVDPASVAMVVADTDHRTSRVMELMALATEGLPHLDAAADVKTSGGACGACGAVPALAALALAAHHARERAAPVLCVSNEDTHHRGAILVRPPVLQS